MITLSRYMVGSKAETEFYSLATVWFGHAVIQNSDKSVKKLLSPILFSCSRFPSSTTISRSLLSIEVTVILVFIKMRTDM